MKQASIGQEILSFGADVRRYFGIILSLLRYEEMRRRAKPADAVLEMLEPVLLIAVMTAAMWFVGRRTGSPLGGHPVLFYASGFFALYFFIYLSNRMRRAVDSPGKRFPLEQRLDHILVHLFLKVIDYTILGFLMFGVIYFAFTKQALPHDFTPIIQAFAAIIAIGFGWGVFNMVVGRVWQLWRFVFPSVNRCLVIFTGVIFLVDFLSPTARYVLSFIPITQAVSLFRSGFYPDYPALVLDKQYLAHCAIIAVVLGLVLERVTRRSEGR